MNSEIKNIVAIIPNLPGCYQFIDDKGVVIYVGKAKELRKRVASYFNREHENPKTAILVRKIKNIKYIVVDSEEDTLLLENNLIKNLKPRYNVQLKDDKSYPSIVIRNENFPRIYKTRKILKDGSLYWGPYASVKSVNALIDIIRKVYKIRSCRLNLTSENIAAGKFKVCLEYHIKRCKGPCEALQSIEEYNSNVDEVKEILKGNVNIIEREIIEKMEQLSDKMRYEEANDLKEKLQLIQNFREKSQIVTDIAYSLDVFSYEDDDKSAYINYLHVVNGGVYQAYNFEYKKKLDEKPENLLGLAIVEMRQRWGSSAKTVLVPFLPDIFLNGVNFELPQRGDKRKLLLLSEKNVKQYKIDKLKKREMLSSDQRVAGVLAGIKKDLRLQTTPWRIDCIDISNIQGTNSVAASVVFIKGKPAKKEYRRYGIKSVQGADDYASIQEVMKRRYSRLIKEPELLPQLIVIDGGKGQLNAALKTMQKIGLYGKIDIIAIAERLEEIFIPGDPIPLYIDKNSMTLKIIQQIRDEAHRFGISFHREKRSKAQIISELDNIKGIGGVSKQRLLTHFKSVKRIKEADHEEIKKIIGVSRGEILIDWIKKESKKS